MSILDRFFQALRDGDPAAQQAEDALWAAHASLPPTAAAEAANALIDDWAHSSRRPPKDAKRRS